MTSTLDTINHIRESWIKLVSDKDPMPAETDRTQPENGLSKASASRKDTSYSDKHKIGNMTDIVSA